MSKVRLYYRFLNSKQYVSFQIIINYAWSEENVSVNQAMWAIVLVVVPSPVNLIVKVITKVIE